MEKEYRFRSLTSNKNVEIQPVTLQALEYVISDDSEPTNVAITGNYGAGKSSVVESFEKHLQNSSSPKIGIIKRLSEFLKKLKIKSLSIFLLLSMMKLEIMKKKDLITVKLIPLKERLSINYSIRLNLTQLENQFLKHLMQSHEFVLGRIQLICFLFYCCFCIFSVLIHGLI